ncbi:hypothetical protein F4808DRAFT_467877 [Astrocystis sublimbata]|nr:hypothetical protein F4808DRAFT_467877 [Astrocystis sublimbata]
MSSTHPNHVSVGYRNYDIITAVFIVLCTPCVILRFIQRRRIHEIWWDDWTILPMSSAGESSSQIFSSRYLLLAQQATILRLIVLHSFQPGQRRIFSVDARFLIFMRIMLFLIVGTTLSAVFGLIFSYNPVQAQWDFSLPHTTIDTNAFYIAVAVINILLDLSILAFAQYRLWNLHMQHNRKLLLSIVFLFWAITIISSILRIVYLEKIDINDSTYTITIPGIWTNVEMYLSIICGCLPVLYSLFRPRFQRLSAKKYLLSSGASKSRGPLLTIGSGSTRPAANGSLDDCASHLGFATHEVLCEPCQDGETHSMGPLDPIRVRTDYKVAH